MALLIDTDLLIDVERGQGPASVSDAFGGDEPVAISVITVSELLHGVHRAKVDARVGRRAAVERLLDRFQAIPITEPVARVHAEIWGDLAVRGEVIGRHDLWIAATAVAHGFGVATRNVAEFERVPGLRVVSV